MFTIFSPFLLRNDNLHPFPLSAPHYFPARKVPVLTEDSQIDEIWEHTNNPNASSRDPSVEMGGLGVECRASDNAFSPEGSNAKGGGSSGESDASGGVWEDHTERSDRTILFA